MGQSTPFNVGNSNKCRSRIACVVLALMILLPRIALATETSRIIGQVLDPKGVATSASAKSSIALVRAPARSGFS